MEERHAAAGISYRQEVLRKLIHLSSLWMVAAIMLIPQRWLTAAFFSVMLVLNLLVERAYSAGVPVVTPLFRFFFGRMIRRPPQAGQWVVTGSPPVWAAAALVSILFPRPFAASALAAMLIGDTAAALIGRRFGRHKTFNGKSYEGVAAFICAGFPAVLLVLQLCGALVRPLVWGALAGVVLAAVAELFEKQLHIDDNFSIPAVVGAVLTLVHWAAA